MSGLGLHVLRLPSGRWGFVGHVPLALGYVRKSDGGVPTDAELADDQRMPGGPQFRRLATRVFATETEARAAAAVLAAEVLP